MGRGSNKNGATRGLGMEWPVLFVKKLSVVVICDGQPEAQRFLETHPLPKVKPSQARVCKSVKTGKIFRKLMEYPENVTVKALEDLCLLEHIRNLCHYRYSEGVF